MSGSPILGDDGRAIAVCCTGSGNPDLEDGKEGGPNPGLVSLPGWFLEELGLHVHERGALAKKAKAK
jgi:hypothetical protein